MPVVIEVFILLFNLMALAVNPSWDPSFNSNAGACFNLVDDSHLDNQLCCDLGLDDCFDRYPSLPKKDGSSLYLYKFTIKKPYNLHITYIQPTHSVLCGHA